MGNWIEGHAANNNEIDPRLYEVGISLLVGGTRRQLSEGESQAVINHFSVVRAEAARWRLKLGTPGRLLLVDYTLCVTISKFLDHLPEEPH